MNMKFKESMYFRNNICLLMEDKFYINYQKRQEKKNQLHTDVPAGLSKTT